MKDKNHDIDPGPPSTREEAQKADAEALALINTIRPFNRKKIVDYIRNHPPSAEVIAALAFYGFEKLDKANRSADGKSGIEARYEKEANLRRALQETVNRSVAQLTKEGKRATSNNVLEQIIMNQETSVKISDCEIEIDGDKIVCTDNYDDTIISLVRRSFERYVTTAK